MNHTVRVQPCNFAAEKVNCMKKSKKTMKNQFSVIESIPSEKYLTFSIDGQLYTIPTSEVVEIIRVQPITFMPNLPNYVKGVINLRGKIVPLIDMRLKFCKAEKEYDSRTSIIIVEKSDMVVGLIVDSVKDVRDIAKNQVCKAPSYKKTVGDSYVCGIASLEHESALVLDIEKVLTQTENRISSNRSEPEQPLVSIAQ
jgi:purine-binding chemotaxis protein CheW